MTITYPLTLPDVFRSKTVTPSLQYIVSATKSPFTLERQAFRWPGEAWAFEYSGVAQTREEAEEIIAFMNRLRGSYGTFLLGDLSSGVPLGVGGGTPQVDGGGQSGYYLNVKGGPASVAGWYKKGTWLQIGTGASARLYKLTSDADTDGYGESVWEITPSLREAPADSAAIILSNPVGVFNMVNNLVTWTTDENGHFRITFRAEEALG